MGLNELLVHGINVLAPSFSNMASIRVKLAILCLFIGVALR